MELRNRDRDSVPFTTKDGSTIREYVRSERQSLAEATLAPGQATERHYHLLSEEIYTILEGGGCMEVNGEWGTVGPGDTILIPAGSWHQLASGHHGARFLCCCVPPYSHEDTYFG